MTQITDAQASDLLQQTLMDLFSERGILPDGKPAKVEVYIRPCGQIAEVSLSGNTWGVSWLRPDPGAIGFVAAVEEVLQAMLVARNKPSDEANAWVVDAMWLLNEVEV